MVSQKDIYISAQLLIKEHGKKAEEVAEQRMHELLGKDDPKGAGAWLSIMGAINDLNTVAVEGKLH